jgi:predicted nucleotidyltransferase component of viral defense system
MNVSLEFLEQSSAETNFSVSTLEKVVRLGELAADASRHPALRDALVLKGGSALNLCFGAPSRLSVDLDFNYVGHSQRERMLEDRPRVEAAVEELARRRGYSARRSADAFAGRKVFLAYRSALGDADRIEIDLNYLFRVPLAGTEEREMWQPGGLDRPRVSVVSLAELCIGKIIALLDRAAPRDLWDVGRLPQVAGEALSAAKFRARFLVVSAILNHPLSSYDRDRVLRRVTERTIREQLAPMLAGGVMPTLEALREDAWQVVAPLLALEPSEREFVAAIQGGEYRHELLAPDMSEVARNLESHPAIQWKLQNARDHARRQSTAASRRPKLPTDDSRR